MWRFRRRSEVSPVASVKSSGTCSRHMGIVYFKGAGSKETVLTRSTLHVSVLSGHRHCLPRLTPLISDFMLMCSDMLLYTVVQLVVLESHYSHIPIDLQEARHCIEYNLPVAFGLHTFDIGACIWRASAAVVPADMSKFLQTLCGALSHHIKILMRRPDRVLSTRQK